MKYKLRMWIGDKLFKFGELIDDLSRKAYGWEPPKQTQKELDISIHSLTTKVFLRANFPCKTCNGEGAIETHTGDIATCFDCFGIGIDLEKIRE